MVLRWMVGCSFVLLLWLGFHANLPVSNSTWLGPVGENYTISPAGSGRSPFQDNARRHLHNRQNRSHAPLEVIHPDAGGIDIGNESHYVAVPPSRDSQSAREFGCTTAELKAMAVWLKQCRIRTVAMQSTGVYWVAVYDILEQAGLEGALVNARDTKNLPGRK